MTRFAQGVVRGKTIELAEDLGMPDGQPVEVIVRSPKSVMSPGQGIRRSAGGLAGEWTAEDDQILEQIARDRKRESRRAVPQ